MSSTAQSAILSDPPHTPSQKQTASACYWVYMRKIVKSLWASCQPEQPELPRGADLDKIAAAARVHAGSIMQSRTEDQEKSSQGQKPAAAASQAALPQAAASLSQGKLQLMDGRPHGHTHHYSPVSIAAVPSPRLSATPNLCSSGPGTFAWLPTQGAGHHLQLCAVQKAHGKGRMHGLHSRSGRQPGRAVLAI